VKKKNVIAQVRGLSKSFKVYSGGKDILREWMTFGLRSYHKDYQALKNISFDLYKGEFVGIIGQNGAGKSTLLRVITDVLKPTEGTYKVSGRVLSILELSGGTDKDLTGRENVIRSGQLLGLPDGYVHERMDVIKEFSELEDFFDQPLRMYSTGMRTRLAFSMFAFLDTDLLILDEVLAVGDIFFKQKCFARLAELIEKKTSIVLVTHSMGIVQRYCSRVIVLEKGEKIFDGDPGKAIRLYLQLRGEQKAKAIGDLQLDEEGSGLDIIPTIIGQPAPQKGPIVMQQPPSFWPEDNLFLFRSFPKLRGKGRVNFTRMAVLNDKDKPTLTFEQGEKINIYCEFRLKRDVDVPVFNIEIRDRLNLLIHSKSSIQNGVKVPYLVPQGSVVHYSQSITLNITPGNYIVNISCSFLSKKEYQQLEKTGYRAAIKNMALVWRLDQAFAFGILARSGKKLDVVHGGLCDLPGNGQIQVSNNNNVL